MRKCRLLSLVFLLAAALAHGQSSEDRLVQNTQAWLHAISAGDRTALNDLMDPHFIATTPGGDVLTKERLVPSQADRRAQLWAEDMIFALHQLTVVASDRSSMFHGAINFAAVGAFGHSHGGRSAAAVCLLDERIRACLNEDGQADSDLQRPYWPIPGHSYHGAFATLDWFDPGVTEDDLRAMHTSLAAYAQSRLKPGAAALAAYRAADAGSYRLTMLQPGMMHTAFSDLRWITATSEDDRARYAEYLATIRITVRQFFEQTLLSRAPATLACGASDGQLLTQCFQHADGPRK